MATKTRERTDSFSIRVSPLKWQKYREVAEARGKPLNRWIIQWLDEAVRYERLELREKEQAEAARGSGQS
jgi:hypothetical protein